ncbi:HmuY family protein [Flavobacterium rivuli]|uniref:HmuY family protein n=1 Tax=Flavobacterium rivuli TaxID=498301 RepID=UPI000367A406|nr:HmuY family protein [Flavobacterium rivuli]
MKKIVTLFAFVVALLLTACNEDDNGTNRMGVSFAVESVNITDAVTPVKILFYKDAPSDGFVTISYTTQNVAYGADFTTNTAAEGGTFTLPFTAGATAIEFNFNKITNAAEGEVKNVVFKIAQISLSQVEITGNETVTLNFNETASTGGPASPLVGGSNQPNQVYFDLSSGQYKTSLRSNWDLGFYGGDNFRVVINGSIGMAVKQLTTTDIDAIQTSNNLVSIGTFDPANAVYIDNPNGFLSGTAIAEVSANDADNKVYLVNMGFSVPTTPAGNGAVSVAGPLRGWKKIRILRDSNGYKLQYADLNATTHTEVAIAKDPVYNFTYYSLQNNAPVTIEPEKATWDLNFTTFTNIIEGAGSYFYSDFVITNAKGGTRAYEVLTSAIPYDNFTAANLVTDDARLKTDTEQDQRIIGANWRNVIPVQLYSDRYYIIKDPAGNIYKLRFTALLSQQGERGNPSFQYALVQ